MGAEKSKEQRSKATKTAQLKSPKSEKLSSIPPSDGSVAVEAQIKWQTIPVHLAIGALLRRVGCHADCVLSSYRHMLTNSETSACIQSYWFLIRT